MTKFPLIACLLVLSAAASLHARPLTKREEGYVQALEGLAKLRRKSARGLTSKKTGAAGVQVRFEGLTLVRLHFPSVSAAQAYVAKRAATRSATKRVEARGAEVLLVGGPHAASFEGLGWSASLDAPSVVAKTPERAAQRAAKPTKPAPVRLGRLSTLVRPKPSTLPSSALAGTYLLAGDERVVIDQVEVKPEGAHCRVRLIGFPEREDQQRVFQATFNGKVLVLELDQTKLPRGAANKVSFLCQRSANPKTTFVRFGGTSELLPSSLVRFWITLPEQG